MENSRISTEKKFFCRNDKNEIVNLIYDAKGITHVALSRITGSDTYRMLNRMSKSGVIKENITTLFSEKKSSVFYVKNFDIRQTQKLDLLSWAPFFFRKTGVMVGKVTASENGLKFPIYDSEINKKYAELTIEKLEIPSNSNEEINVVYVTNNRQKFLEYVDENSLSKNALFIVLFKEGDYQFITAYHSFSSKVEKLNSSNFFKFLNVKPIFDPEFYKGAKSMYYSKKISGKGEKE